MVSSAYCEVMRNFDVLHMVIVNVEKMTAEHFGDESGLGNTDLLKTLFGDRNALISLAESLEGQQLPRIWSQGSMNCVVCKPAPTEIVALMCRSSGNVIEDYRHSKKLSDAVAVAWHRTRSDN